MSIQDTLTFDCGKAVSFAVTPEQLAAMWKHDSVQRHIITIGLKNILQDSHASVVREDYKTDDEWIAAKRKRAGEKFESLLAGDVRTARAGGAPRVDSFTTYARRLVLSLLSKEKRKALADEADKGVAFVDAVFAKNEGKLRPQVEALIVEAEAKAKAAAELATGLELDV